VWGFGLVFMMQVLGFWGVWVEGLLGWAQDVELRAQGFELQGLGFKV